MSYLNLKIAFITGLFSCSFYLRNILPTKHAGSLSLELLALFHYFVLKPSISVRIFPKFPDSVFMHTLLFFLSYHVTFSKSIPLPLYDFATQRLIPTIQMLLETILGIQGRNPGCVLADSDLKQFWGQHPCFHSCLSPLCNSLFLRDNILVSISVYHLPVIHYFLPVKIVSKKQMPISTHE